MKIITKDFLYQFLYFLCIAVPYLNVYELTFLVWLVAVGITIKRAYSVTFLKYLLYPAAILLIAALVSIGHSPETFELTRDFTYLFKPIAGLLAGYQLYRFGANKAFKVFIYTGFIIAIIHLIIILISFVSHTTVSVNILRANAGYFSDYEVYVLIILIFRKRFNIVLSPAWLRVVLTVVALSSFLYLARTNLIQFIILYMGIQGYFRLNRRSINTLCSVLIVVIVGYTAIYYSNPRRNGLGIEAFLYKIKIAPIEAFKTKINKDNWKDFNDNYRSYENIIAVKQVSNNGIFAVLFGEGLGSTLDLGREVWSNDGEFVRYIPIVHNGFMTIFLKSGIIGAIILIGFIVRLIRQKRAVNPIVQNINFLLTATGIFLIFSNWVFLGLYLKLDNKSVVIGFLLCMRQMILKNQNEPRMINRE